MTKAGKRLIAAANEALTLTKVYRALSEAAIPNINGNMRSVRYYASVGIDAFSHDPPGGNDLSDERPYFVDKLLWKAAEDIVAALTPQ